LTVETQGNRIAIRRSAPAALLHSHARRNRTNMSVRRLAVDRDQPARFVFSRANGAAVKQWIAKYPKGRQASAVIPLLMLAQEQEGWVTRAAIERVAGLLDMPMIRVLEVATFYTQFQLAPVGARAHVQVCGTTPCMLRGAQDLIELCKKRIHPESCHTNEAGTLSWEEVECQGACVNAPMAMIFKDTYEDLTPERLEEIIDAFEEGRGGTIKPGPQIDRVASAPEGGLTTLLDEQMFARSPRSGGKAAGPTIPPAKAAKPRTEAIETAPAVRSPAKGKSEKPAKAVSAGGRNANRGDRPLGVEPPREPDDLKLIAGIGPKIESVLNELGIFKFEQIAAWKKAERDWVDDYLNFSGRIERDQWVKQAKALARGGADEYFRTFGKKPR
jgi:NADH-quinone oxidoreductase subunit E